MRTLFSALVFSALASPLALAGDTGKVAIGGGIGGALGNVIGQQVGGSTGAAIGAGLGGAAGGVITARDVHGQPLRIDIAAHGSSTGFVALGRGEADLAAASRPINDSEVRQLQALGDLRAAGAEQVIGLDGVAIIVHPDNPIPQLDTRQLAQIFSGQIQRWEQLGIPGGAIHLYARDDRSGTFETFKALVLVLLPSSKTKVVSGAACLVEHAESAQALTSTRAVALRRPKEQGKWVIATV